MLLQSAFTRVGFNDNAFRETTTLLACILKFGELKLAADSNTGDAYVANDPVRPGLSCWQRKMYW